MLHKTCIVVVVIVDREGAFVWNHMGANRISIQEHIFKRIPKLVEVRCQLVVNLGIASLLVNLVEIQSQSQAHQK